MNILITGVAGLIGSRFSDWIIQNKQDCTIIGIDDLSGGYIENVNKNVIFYNRNLFKDDISDIFKNNSIDIVYHFAAYAAEGLSPFIRTFNYKSNVLSTTNIINNCINYDIKRLIFTSSMAVYGNGEIPFHENDTLNPIDPYGVAKFACELDIKIAGEQHGLDWCIIRPHNVYSQNQNIWDKYRNVLGIWMYQHINNMPMTIFGDGEQKRAFSYTDDCLEPLWIAGTGQKSSKEIINLGGTITYSINEANKILRDVIGGGKVEYKEQRHEVKNAFSSWQKSVNILDYQDKTSLYDGLKNMWNWAKKQPNRNVMKWNEYEVNKKIYSFWK